jgi:hypothetical protein
VILTGIVAGVLRYAIGRILDLTLKLTQHQNAIADATTAGILAGLVMYLVLRSARRRRLLVLREMSRIADLNHHVRNSLQVILGAELMKKDANRAVIESCQRIQETIERLFPIVAVERRHHRAHAA